MPMKSMKAGTRHAALVLFVISTFAALFAADIETTAAKIEGAAERWGLWAALALLMVLACMWALWRHTLFIQGTLVALVSHSIDANRALYAAIKAAPCGRNLKDSDAIADPTPEPGELPETMKMKRHNGD